MAREAIAPPPDEEEPGHSVARTWFLGVDLGTTGISAVLLNRDTCQFYPLYWLSSAVGGNGANGADADESALFRLPATVWHTGSEAIAEAKHDQWKTMLRRTPPAAGADASNTLDGLKAYLNLGLPYYSLPTQRWEPTVQWSDRQTLPLIALRYGVELLVATIRDPSLCRAEGLSPEQLAEVWPDLAGVMIGHPVGWSDAYVFNIRQTLLSSGLVSSPNQIMVVEDAIAALLSGVRGIDGRSPTLPQSLPAQQQLGAVIPNGCTVIFSAGATVTDIAVVTLPEQLYQLNHSAFTCRSIAYAGHAIDQDIISQLIYPAALQTLASAGSGSLPDGTGQSSPPSPPADWVWSGRPEPFSVLWARLGLEQLDLPAPGELDLGKRHRLQQRLMSSAFGQGLLAAARQLKLVLQHQDRFTLDIHTQRLVISRQDLGSRVFLHYVHRLNRELNSLLNQTGIPVLNVTQVICTGGTASLGAIARWLRQKLPNATILQDTYNPSPATADRVTNCSRIAHGLAALALHPQLVYRPQQQYGDFFLLAEIVRVFPEHPLSLEDLMQRLEERNIDTEACRDRILSLLEGHLPLGLAPKQSDLTQLTPESVQNPDYQKLLSAPLFYRVNSQVYQPNLGQWHYFRRYLDALISHTPLQWDAPIMVDTLREG